MSTRSKSVLPGLYYFAFALYEPFVAILIFLAILSDPKKVHDQQGPWGNSPPSRLPTATLITTLQLSYLSAVLGLTNVLGLRAARQHLSDNPASQERIVTALMLPLLFGDIAHFTLTVYALRIDGWKLEEWPAMVWVGFGLGFSLFFPRVAWLLGIGRYVDARDGSALKAKRV